MTKVNVKASVFDFYLKSYGLKPEALADRSNIDAEKVLLWSSQDSDISISSLRTLAEVYKKHWGIFLLEKPTEHFKKPRDYRGRSSHHEFGLASRLAFEEANRLISLSATYSLSQIDNRVNSLRKASTNPTTLASRLRSILGITLDIQSKWKRPENAWKFYSESIQKMGFIISIQELDDGVDGFIVINYEGAAIVLNRSVKSVYRRTFTLLHELGHYFQNVSAACNTREVIHEVEAENNADNFASNLLVPASAFATHPLTLEIAAGRSATEIDYSTLSKEFCISMSQVAMRFFSMNLLNRDALNRQLETAERIYKENELAKKKMQDTGGFDPKGHERKAINRVGEPLAASLFLAYKADKITARDFSSSIGVKINLVDRLENMLSNEL